MRSVTATTIALTLLGSSAHAAWLDALPQDPNRIVAAAVVAFCYIAFVTLVIMRHASRRGRAAATASVGHDNAPMLVAYASQTGYAEELARTTSKALQQSNIPARVLSFSDLDAAALARAQTALFIVSTTGEGDPPDPAARFIRTVMNSGVELTGLRYGVLALGDRSFTRFCAFGDAVDDWLATRSGTRMFDAIRVHNGDPAALSVWWRRVEDIVGAPVALPEPAPAGDAWRLIARARRQPRQSGARRALRLVGAHRPAARLEAWRRRHHPSAQRPGRGRAAVATLRSRRRAATRRRRRHASAGRAPEPQRAAAIDGGDRCAGAPLAGAAGKITDAAAGARVFHRLAAGR